MKKIKKMAFGIVGLLFVTAVVRAEVMLQDASPILGKWVLESVAPSLEKPRIPENRTWEFRSDGTIFISGYNRHFGREDSATIQFHIEDGKILSEQPGRPGKYLKYVVYELDDDSMVLKGGMEGFYFFIRK